MKVTDADRERAHGVLVAWLRATPAVDAQVRTVGAQWDLENLIAQALAEERQAARDAAEAGK